MPAFIYAKNVGEAIEWAKKARIKEATETKIRAFYKKNKGIIDPYLGALTPLGVCAGMQHESHYNPTSTSDPVIMESGIWSITPGVALRYNIDPFDVESSIWAGCRMRNERIREILKLYPWLVNADKYDYAKLTMKLPGSFGMGGFKRVMSLMGYGSKAPANEYVQRFPYRAMRNWFLNPANWSRIPKIGRMGPPIIAGRVVRQSGVEFMERVGEVAKVKKGYVKIIGRPAHFPPFNLGRFVAIWTPKVRSYFNKVMAEPPAEREKFALYKKYGAGGLAALASGDPKAWKELVLTKKQASDLYRTIEDFIGHFSPGSTLGLASLVGLLALGGSVGVTAYYSYRERHRFPESWQRLRARFGRR
jgi:hypothetical protein